MTGGTGHRHGDGTTGVDVAVGQWGVFSGEWELRDGPAVRYKIGYAGVLRGYWNGWCIPAMPRTAVEALIASQNAARARIAAHIATRHPDWDQATIERAVDMDLVELELTDPGVLLVHGSDTPGVREVFYTIRPDEAGLYRAGLDWCWDPVTPASCDHVAGT